MPGKNMKIELLKGVEDTENFITKINNQIDQLEKAKTHFERYHSLLKGLLRKLERQEEKTG